MKFSFKLTALALCALTVLSAFVGCSSAVNTSADLDENAEQAIEVQVSYPEKKNLSRDTEFVGRVESGSSVNVFSEVPAKILNTYKNLGEYVLAGELLMEVDDTDMQTALINAQSSLANARLTMQKTDVTADSSTSGSAYLTKQLTNGKNLSDLLDSYYESLRSGNKLNSTLDEYTADLWKATSDKEKAQSTYSSALSDQASIILSTDSNGFVSQGINTNIMKSYLTGDCKSKDKAIIDAVIKNLNQEKKYVVDDALTTYKKAATALSTATSAETLAKTSLEVAEDQYDTSASTIDSAIRKVTKNYDYYSKTYNIADTLGAEETRVLNELTMATLQLSCDSAQRGVELAERNVEKCKIYAPVSGTIITKNAVASNFASAAQPMYVISSEEATPVISFNVSEDGADALNVGSTVTAVINSKEYSATITEIANSTSANSGLFAAKAALPADSDVSRSGSVVKVKASTAEADNVLTLPLSVIDYDENQPYVLVYRDKRAVRCDLELGMSTHEDVEVLSGINAQDAIITTWHPELRNGSLVSCKALEGETVSNDIEIIE